MTRKKIISITIIILVVIFGIYQVFVKKEKSTFALAEVSRGNIFQEVSETGTVKKGEEINLSFKNAGRIEKIYVKVGDKVEAGQDLAKFDSSELFLQLKESQATLQVIQAKKANAEVSLRNAQQSLEDTIILSEENLTNAYQDALDVLDDAYLKIYNAYTTVSSIKRTYFERGDLESIVVVENKIEIEKALDQAKFYIDNAKKTLENEDIDLALSKVKEALLNVKDALEVIRDTVGTGAYRDIVSDSDRTSLDTRKSDINTANSNIVDSQQNISVIKMNNIANINTAKSKVSEIENQLQETQEGLYQAQIKQAQAQISLIENQIQEATIINPTEGQITKVNKRVGEMVQVAEAVISLIPASPFQIEADIYEEDIVKVHVGNSVDIILAAFPDEFLKGKVVSIDPIEKLIEGVVYYEAIIDFNEPPEKIKPGMTADIIITTASRENVLIMPERAVEKKDGKTVVQILRGKTLEEREIEVGLEGSDDMVEVISGLKEGEKVVIK